jgi:phosphate-selective porin OprO/OprP
MDRFRTTDGRRVLWMRGAALLAAFACLQPSLSRGQAVDPARQVQPTVPPPSAAQPPTALPVPQGWPVNAAPAPAGNGAGMPTTTPAEKQPIHLDATWDDGLRFQSADERFHLHVGGAGQIDSVWLVGPHSLFDTPSGSTSGVGNAAATQIRRAVLQADGDIFDQFDYIVQFDFANASNDNSGLQPPSFGNLTSSPAPHNIWMQVRDVPWLGNVRFGNQVKPIGMENNTPFTFLPFMERSDNMDAFYGPFDNGYALGFTARNWSESERLTWQFGVYRPSTNVFGVALNKTTYGARVTALPVYQDDGARLVHVGLGFYGGEIVQDQNRSRVRPLLRNAPGFAVPVLADTGEVPGSDQYTIAPEFAFVLGPLTVQAEWAGQFLTDALSPSAQPQGTVFFHGGYVQALYFLTGEHDEYLRTEGVFGRQVPHEDYHLKKGDPHRSLGAWQVGVRFGYVDLNDKAIQGGTVYDWTVGLNWYLNANMKVQFNYILEHRNQPGAPEGWIDGFGVRAAYCF